MNITFDFGGEAVTASWNGKTYANGARYVSVKRGYQSARGAYNAGAGYWTKRVGSPAYDAAIEAALGWNVPTLEPTPEPEPVGEDGLTDAEREELRAWKADPDANNGILYSAAAPVESSAYEVRRETEYIHTFSTVRHIDTWRIVRVEKDGSLRYIDGKNAYNTKQAAYRRCRQLNHPTEKKEILS